VGRATLAVDITAVGAGTAHLDGGTERPVELRPCHRRRAVGAVEHDPAARQREVGADHCADVIQVATFELRVDTFAADLRRRAVFVDVGHLRDQPLDSALARVIELVAVAAEQLEAVVMERIVGRRYDAAGVEAEPELGLDRRARQARVSSDQDARLGVGLTQHARKRLADATDGRRVERWLPGHTANAVGSEQFGHDREIVFSTNDVPRESRADASVRLDPRLGPSIG